MTNLGKGSQLPSYTYDYSQPQRRAGNLTLVKSKPSGPYTYEGTVDSLVQELRPAFPLHILYPRKIEEAARQFLEGIPGTPMYAVKCNPDKNVLQALLRSGISAFDVASIDEVRSVRKLSRKARLFFMHPIKAREAIGEAYFKHNVRAFVLDEQKELNKILQETRLAADLELFVRIAVVNDKARVSLSGKFGAPTEDAVNLLRLCRPACARLGVSFHVGSQCMEPDAYRSAIAQAAAIIAESGVKIDILDVGGGFPVHYEGMTPPPLSDYFATIRQAVADYGFADLEILAEPGRGLVGNAGSMIARVELARTHTLHLNDGTYGGLFEGGKQNNIPYPVRRIRTDYAEPQEQEMKPFRLAGPTCDSIDVLDGPFMLPADIEEGDWIEFRQHGAYGVCSRSSFNGFGEFSTVVMKD